MVLEKHDTNYYKFVWSQIHMSMREDFHIDFVWQGEE